MKSKLVIIIIIIVLAIILIGWYLYSYFTWNNQPGPTIPLNQIQDSGVTDSTDDISKELNQIPDDSSMVNEVNSLDETIKSF